MRIEDHEGSSTNLAKVLPGRLWLRLFTNKPRDGRQIVVARNAKNYPIPSPSFHQIEFLETNEALFETHHRDKKQESCEATTNKIDLWMGFCTVVKFLVDSHCSQPSIIATLRENPAKSCQLLVGYIACKIPLNSTQLKGAGYGK